MPSERHPPLDVAPEEFPRVVRAFRGVRDVVLHNAGDGSPLRLEVMVHSPDTEQPHWLELLQRTVAILARSAFPGPVEVIISPSHEDDLDASLDR